MTYSFTGRFEYGISKITCKHPTSKLQPLDAEVTPWIFPLPHMPLGQFLVETEKIHWIQKKKMFVTAVLFKINLIKI